LEVEALTNSELKLSLNGGSGVEDVDSPQSQVWAGIRRLQIKKNLTNFSV